MNPTTRLWLIVAFCSTAPLAPAAFPSDLLIADFEGTNYGSWQATGSAFRHGPARDSQWLALDIENGQGRGVASSELDGDAPIGTLTSPRFKIQRAYISFHLAGGNYEHHTCLNLLVDGKIVRSATGWKSDRFVPDSWDVRAWAGQEAQIQLVDEATGGWGHLNVDQIVQTDQPARLPEVRSPLYQEALRPQFHFSARQWTMNRLNPGSRQEGWINDLNGLIFYDGEYHLFAQRWNKCWIHALSKDLVHWTELEPAFWEEQLDSGVQSGTCVVDYANTSGLGPDPKRPPLVAFWSRNDNRSQCLSYSLDHGRTWKHYEKNPLMVRPERDPKVFWYPPGRHWVMMLYGERQYHIFTSRNLLDWKDEHHPIANSYECPDFFELPVTGQPDQKKWVLIQGNGNYLIGTFNGTEFKEETPRYPCDVGPNFYATQSWHNTETGDGRRIQVAWMRGAEFVDMPFNQMISFPCELTLQNAPAGLRLFRRPIPEIALLQQEPDAWTNRTLQPNQSLPLEPSGQLFRLQAEVSIPPGARLIFNVRGLPVILATQSVESGHAPAAVQESISRVEILVDRTSIETFVNDGEVSSTRFALFKGRGLAVKAEGGRVLLRSLTIHPLVSAWPKAE